MQTELDLTGVQTCPTCSGSGRVDLDALAILIKMKNGPASADHPETSHHAARTNRVLIGNERYKVLTILAKHGPQTAAEVSEHTTTTRNQVGARLKELRDEGLVGYRLMPSGDFMRRPTGPSSWGRVQEITDLGRMLLARCKVENWV